MDVLATMLALHRQLIGDLEGLLGVLEGPEQHLERLRSAIADLRAAAALAEPA